MNEAVRTIESVADDAWISWAGQLIPNIVRRVREEMEARDREERERRIREEAEVKERLVREEAEREVREEAERVARRERRQQEKLDLFLNESITAEEFKKDSEAEESEVTGVAIVEDKVGAQVSEMEVDDAGEDEVVVEDLKSKGGRKRAPSSPPKPSRKRMCASTAIGSKPTVIERTDSSARAVTACERCHYHNIKCTPTNAGARCSNCKAKHYKCSFVPAKESSEPKISSLGARLMKIAVGGQTKAQEKKDAAKKAKAFRGVTLGMFRISFHFF